MGADPSDTRSLARAVSIGLRGRCPQCGKGRLFSGFVTTAPACEVCGLDLAFADAGDGPAVFVIMIVGFLVVGAALWIELRVEPPYWLMAAIFGPLTIGLCLGMLRPLKGLLISLQFHHKAREGRFDGF